MATGIAAVDASGKLATPESMGVFVNIDGGGRGVYGKLTGNARGTTLATINVVVS